MVGFSSDAAFKASFSRGAATRLETAAVLANIFIAEHKFLLLDQ